VLSASISIILLYLGLSLLTGGFFYCPKNTACRSFGETPVDLNAISPIFLAASIAAAVTTFWVAFRIKSVQ